MRVSDEYLDMVSTDDARAERIRAMARELIALRTAITSARAMRTAALGQLLLVGGHCETCDSALAFDAAIAELDALGAAHD